MSELFLEKARVDAIEALLADPRQSAQTLAHWLRAYVSEPVAIECGQHKGQSSHVVLRWPTSSVSIERDWAPGGGTLPWHVQRRGEVLRGREGAMLVSRVLYEGIGEGDGASVPARNAIHIVSLMPDLALPWSIPLGALVPTPDLVWVGTPHRWGLDALAGDAGKVVLLEACVESIERMEAPTPAAVAAVSRHLRVEGWGEVPDGAAGGPVAWVRRAILPGEVGA